MILLASIAASLLVAWVLFGLFFSDRAEFLNAIRLFITPDVILAARGEWQDSHGPHLKVFFYLALVVGTGVMTKYSLTHLWN